MEPGANPGRTGHCECGALFIMSLVWKILRRQKAAMTLSQDTCFAEKASGMGLLFVLEISVKTFVCFVRIFFICPDELFYQTRHY